MANKSLMVSKIFGHERRSYSNSAQKVREIAGIPMSELTDEDFIPIPIDYKYNKNTDNYNVFIFIRKFFNEMEKRMRIYLEEVTIGNKPLAFIMDNKTNGKSFKRIVEDGEVTHIYMIKKEKRTLPKSYRTRRYSMNEDTINEITLGKRSGEHHFDYEKRQIAIAKKNGSKKQLAEAISKFHESKAGRRNNMLKTYHNILARQLIYTRLPKYKKSKLEAVSEATIMSAVANVFRECAEYYAGNNPTFPSKLPKQFSGSQRVDINIHNFLSNMTSTIDDFHYEQESKYATKDEINTKKLKLFEYIRSFIREEVPTEV